MFNIKKLAIERNGTMEVREADGTPARDEQGNVLTITFHSPGTKEFQAAKHRYEESRSNTLSVLMGKGDKREAGDENRAVAEFLAACTVSFNGFEYPGKAGYEGFKALYADLELGHIAADANKFLGDRGNFLQKKPDSSFDTSDKQPG